MEPSLEDEIGAAACECSSCSGLPACLTLPAEESLRAQVNAITNWDQFKAGNNLSGWDFDTATTKAGFVHYCNWTGIACVNLAVTTL